MARYSSKERIGVQRFALLVEEHSDWIFREQTIADVGVDAIIEQTINDDPNGALVACQIKSGNGNFKRKKDGTLVYYISNVHYEYWTNHDLPVMLILVDDNETIFWGFLNHNTIEETKTRFKTEIPKNQKLLPENINDIFERVLHNKNPRNLIVSSGEADVLLDEMVDYITIAKDSLQSRVNAQKASIKNLEKILNKANSIINSGNINAPKLIDNQLNRAATQYNVLAERLKSEVKISASSFASFSHTMRKCLADMKYTKDKEPMLNNLSMSLEDFNNALADNIEASQQQIDIFKILKSDNKKYKKAKEYNNTVTALYIKEIGIMRSMIKDIIELITNKNIS